MQMLNEHFKRLRIFWLKNRLSAENVYALITTKLELNDREALPQHMDINNALLLKMTAKNVYKPTAKTAKSACRFYAAEKS